MLVLAEGKLGVLETFDTGLVEWEKQPASIKTRLPETNALKRNEIFIIIFFKQLNSYKKRDCSDKYGECETAAWNMVQYVSFFLIKLTIDFVGYKAKSRHLRM